MTLRALKNSVANQHQSYGILRRSFAHLNTCIENCLDNPQKYLSAEDVRKDFLTIGFSSSCLEKYMMLFKQKLDLSNSQSRVHARKLLEKPGTNAFRKWCLRKFLKNSESVMYWTVLINLIPITTEIVIVFTRTDLDTETLHNMVELRFAELFNGVLALVYIRDAVVRIGALGFKTFFETKINIIDFVGTIAAAVQIVYAIVLFTAFQHLFTMTSLYVLLFLNVVRLIRILKVISTGIFKYILNLSCSAFYQAFDLAMGFITANEEIVKYADEIVEHKQSARSAQYAAETNIHDMLCFVEKLEKEHPYAACAWRTHRATICILRNMKHTVEELVSSYMIDETDAEQLLEEINSKLLEILSYPRFIKSKEGVENILMTLEWIYNENILKTVMENHSLQTFSRNEVVQEAEEKHSNLKLLHKGIIQISGISSREKSEILPNTDSFLYFYRKGNFIDYIFSPQPLGLLGYLLQTPSVTSVTASNFSEFICIEYETIVQLEKQFEDLSFYIWRPIALQIAYAVLTVEYTYRNWLSEKLKIHLEEGILPNLVGKTEFELHSVITDMVLVQGRVKSKGSDRVFVGPTYIPGTVRSLILMDDPQKRPRIVMVLLREEKYHAHSIMGWVKEEDITYKSMCIVHGLKQANLWKKQVTNEPSDETLNC